MTLSLSRSLFLCRSIYSVCTYTMSRKWMGFIFGRKSTTTNRGLDVSRAYNPDAISPDQMMSGPNIAQQGTIRMTSATPTMQQRIKALGVATPIALSSPVRRYVSASSSHWFEIRTVLTARQSSIIIIIEKRNRSP